MKTSLFLGAALLLPRPVSAAEADPFAFFMEEAQVVTASRRREPLRRAPATTYVVTSQDIKASGALNLWDALRAVPGLDVASSRAAQGEIGIRGLDKALSNRVLVLLDGRTALNGYFDFVVWESIPVTLEEIDRVEIVEGPASALYGPNAVSGVINIITKTPRQLQGGVVGYAGGERGTHDAGALYGDEKGPWSYKLGLGWRTTDRFEEAGRLASLSRKAHGLAAYRVSEETKLSLSGGYSDAFTRITTGNNGAADADGPTSFVRADLESGPTRLRAFWNRGRLVASSLTSLNEPLMAYDVYDAELTRALSLPADNDLVVGASYRKNTASSRLFAPGTLEQDLWALFFEDEWKAHEKLRLVASGRLDRHPFTPLLISPRGSLIFDPSPAHVLRFSAGTSFRNPTLLENYLSLSRTTPPPPFTVEVTSFGNRDLDPERMTMYELAHGGRFGRLKTTLAGFHYQLTRIIAQTPITALSGPPIVRRTSSFANQFETRAFGGEAGAEYLAADWLTVSGNYSYQSLTDNGSHHALEAPKHKANAGLRAAKRGWLFDLRSHWVGPTMWNRAAAGAAFDYVPLPEYYLFDARLAYAFAGAWNGLELGVNAFNLLDRRHAQILSSAGAAAPGQNGEVLGRRLTGTVSYRF